MKKKKVEERSEIYCYVEAVGFHEIAIQMVTSIVRIAFCSRKMSAKNSIWDTLYCASTQDGS